ncbi:MAG: acyl-CoA dehydrogenase family protein [Reyranella sp.]|jgi:acyl-CoA dehydrogenase|uniref:acyl-CoA dehydrogenase family protein n=1 Tax=Reyranella sp. TaxID=1929291 RepID=UPI0025E280FE|nr:acyl-CoA dehydrogenase family protein [Reyranella sp.]MBR2818906.1 acyl-CoA dehydrogenase family protein [Reyranella sp.]
MTSQTVFGHSQALLDMRDRLRDFVDREAIPREHAELAHDVEKLDHVARLLREKAKAAGLYAPQLPTSHGGLGLSWKERAVILEEAGRSFLGPLAINCAPPDQPNMINLMLHGTAEQRARYLEPLIRGDIRSCFAMTEPAPGAGSDPSMLKTTARRKPGGWIIDGRKWFISGAVGAAFAIVLAQTDAGATMFIVEAGNPGYRVLRNIASIDGFQIGGHGEIEFAGCEVNDDAVLGEIGKGFAYAQQRLEPARISHCMRFIGRASRAMSIAQTYANTRTSFGSPLADLQQIQAMVADSHIDLHASRLMTWHAAAKMDAGESVKHESAMTKVFVSEAVCRVADRAAQIMGALGMSEDTPVSLILRELRPFRIYDGASELHRATLARRILREDLRP